MVMNVDVGKTRKELLNHLRAFDEFVPHPRHKFIVFDLFLLSLSYSRLARSSGTATRHDKLRFAIVPGKAINRVVPIAILAFV